MVHFGRQAKALQLFPFRAGQTLSLSRVCVCLSYPVSSVGSNTAGLLTMGSLGHRF